jgi:AcrR family transcriptional regulator
METNAPPVMPRGRPRKFDRAEALEQAMFLFWERGYEATAIHDLTEIMGIAPPSLYAAFGDKKRLFLESVDLYQTTFTRVYVQALESRPSAREAVEKMLLETARLFTLPECPTGCMIVLSAINGGETSADVLKEIHRRRSDTGQLIRSRIVAGANAGEFMTDDVAALAAFYVTVFQGMAIKARDGASRNELEAVVHQAMRAWPKR